MNVKNILLITQVWLDYYRAFLAIGLSLMDRVNNCFHSYYNFFDWRNKIWFFIFHRERQIKRIWIVANIGMYTPNPISQLFSQWIQYKLVFFSPLVACGA